MITKYIKGDVTKTELKFIGQGVNCQNVMGSGAAKAIYEAYPEVKEMYHGYASQFQYGLHNQKELLGEIQWTKSKDKVIYNCFTQLNYGNDGKMYISYLALIECFKRLTESLENEIIAIPKIGSDLGGGDWEIIEQLINEVTEDKLEVWVYEI